MAAKKQPPKNGKNGKAQPDELGILIASDIELEEVEFVDIGEVKFPKGQISGVAGMSGVGKSTLIAWLISAVSNAGKGAVYSSTEDAVSMTKARIQSAGGMTDNVALIDPELATVFPQDIERLGRIIEKRNAAGTPVEVVIVDPYADHFSVPIGNDQAIRHALRPLGILAQEHNVAIILVGHTIKTIKKNGNPQDAFPGKGIINRCRRAYLFGVNPGDPSERALVCIKDQFLGEEGRGFLFTLDEDLVEDDNGTVVQVGNLTLYDTAAKLFWYDVLRPQDDGENSGKRGGRTAELLAIATEWLEDALAPTDDNPSGLMPSADLLAQADSDGITKSTLARAQKAINVQKGRHGGRGSIRHYTWLPEGHPNRVEYLTANPDYAAELTDAAITQAVKDTPVGTTPNPGVGLSDDDLNQLLGGDK